MMHSKILPPPKQEPSSAEILKRKEGRQGKRKERKDRRGKGTSTTTGKRPFAERDPDGETRERERVRGRELYAGRRDSDNIFEGWPLPTTHDLVENDLIALVVVTASKTTLKVKIVI